MRGDSDANVISGGPGDDELNATSRGDRVSGGSGADAITTPRRGARVDCGPGRDRATALFIANRQPATTFAHCETVLRP